MTNEFDVSFSKELAIATQTGGLQVVDEGFKNFSDVQSNSFCSDFKRGLVTRALIRGPTRGRARRSGSVSKSKTTPSTSATSSRR